MIYRQAGSGIRLCGSCPQVTGTALVGAQEPMHQHPCGNAPDFARHGRLRCTSGMSVGVMMAGGPMTWEWEAERGNPEGQYSSASMTVITRTVTAGSVGSGEW